MLNLLSRPSQLWHDSPLGAATRQCKSSGSRSAHPLGGLLFQVSNVRLTERAITIHRSRTIAASLGLISCLAVAPAAVANPLQQQTSTTPRPSRVVYDTYILGPGDSLQIELLDVPELSGVFSIGPDGTLYLPRLRALYVEGLTVEELRLFLTDQFRAYVRKPSIYLRPVGYRPVRIYVGGEVRRPGYYLLSGQQFNDIDAVTEEPDLIAPASSTANKESSATAEAALANSKALRQDQVRFRSSRGLAGSVLFPTVFDAIRTAQGITPFSDLSDVEVTRRQPLSAGGGRLRANLNFMALISDGDESQNIRLFDGDVVRVGKSSVVLREQLLKAGQTNLSPQFLQVYVSGRVNSPGGITLPQGSALSQAIALAGGVKLLKGKVEFIRFTSEGEVDRRQFPYSATAASGSYNNPILMAGDIIRVQDSAFSAAVGLLNELTAPAVGVFSAYSLFKP